MWQQLVFSVIKKNFVVVQGGDIFGIYKSSYNVSNISHLKLPLPGVFTVYSDWQ
jgi:hypothetical protein